MNTKIEKINKIRNKTALVSEVQKERILETLSISQIMENASLRAAMGWAS